MVESEPRRAAKRTAAKSTDAQAESATEAPAPGEDQPEQPVGDDVAAAAPAVVPGEEAPVAGSPRTLSGNLGSARALHSFPTPDSLAQGAAREVIDTQARLTEGLNEQAVPARGFAAAAAQFGSVYGTAVIVDEETGESPDTADLFEEGSNVGGIRTLRRRLIVKHTHPDWINPVTQLYAGAGERMSAPVAEALVQRIKAEREQQAAGEDE